MLLCFRCKTTCDEATSSCPSCGAELGAAEENPRHAFIGREIGGAYLIQELIAEGGMGCVFRAEQKALARSVAIKVIHRHLLHDDNIVSRFLIEARAASRLNHPNSVSVIGFGETDQGELYLVMEYIRGRDLAQVLFEDGPLPAQRVVDVLRQTLAALSEAHELGVVHRDIKPENVILAQMRTRTDFVKVVDFGLAKILDGGGAGTTTRPGLVFGTPAYMAPEQLGQGVPDHRADLYAVGVILFQLLTGRTPYEAETPMKLGIMHLTEAVPDPRKAAPNRDVPEALAAIALKALAKDPADRFQTADEFARALEQALLEIEPPSRRTPLSADRAPCSSCGAELERRHKFCPECGTPVWQRPPAFEAAPLTPGRAQPPPEPEATFPPIRLPLPLIEADEHLTWLHRHRSEPGSALGVVRLVGETGCGKTRILLAFLDASRVARDVLVGPDPWWADVRYHALRRAIVELARLPPDGGEEPDWQGATPTASRGLREVFGRPAGAPLSPEACRYAVAEALRWAIRRAGSGQGSKRVVLAIDDLHRVDGASRLALADVLRESPHARVLVVATHPPDFDPGWPGEVRVLEGLPRAVVQEFVRRSFPAHKTGLFTPPLPTTSPLHLEQLVRFRLEGGVDAPPQLADLVAQRLERFAARERVVIQALAVLGDDVTLDDLRAVLPYAEGIETAVAALAAAHMIQKGPSGLRWSHPLLREVASEAIPVAVRRDLCARAADLARSRGAPLEVLALFLAQAERTAEALALLDEIAEASLACGDNAGAVLALRRGLNLARRGMFGQGLDDPLRTILSLNRKLGEALFRSGDSRAADGALREALDLAGPSGPDRQAILDALARIRPSGRPRHRSGEVVP